MRLALMHRIPGQANLRDAHLYDALASLLDAGMLPGAAVRQAGVQRWLGPERLPAVTRAIDQGGSLADGFAAAGTDGLTTARVRAAEHAGRLVAHLRRLSEQKKRSGEMIQKTAGRLLYPLMIIHLAVLAGHIGDWMNGRKGAALAHGAVMLIPVYFLLFAGSWILSDVRRGGPWCARLASVPLLRGAVVSAAAATLFDALGDLYESGVPLPKAMAVASSGVGEPFRSAALGASRTMERGTHLTAAIAAAPFADDTTIALLGPAEISGTLGRTLPHVAELREKELMRWMKAGVAGPGALMFMISIGFVIWAMWTTYLGPMQSVLSELR